MNTEQLLQGLKHYRRIARQDLLRAARNALPRCLSPHAEARRALYGELEAVERRAAPRT